MVEGCDSCVDVSPLLLSQTSQRTISDGGPTNKELARASDRVVTPALRERHFTGRTRRPVVGRTDDGRAPGNEEEDDAEERRVRISTEFDNA